MRANFRGQERLGSAAVGVQIQPSNGGIGHVGQAREIGDVVVGGAGGEGLDQDRIVDQVGEERGNVGQSENVTPRSLDSSRNAGIAKQDASWVGDARVIAAERASLDHDGLAHDQVRLTQESESIAADNSGKVFRVDEIGCSPAQVNEDRGGDDKDVGAHPVCQQHFELIIRDRRNDEALEFVDGGSRIQELDLGGSPRTIRGDYAIDADVLIDGQAA